ncbi:hypothetical protein OAB00_02675 [Akkermansiaceae bacterium]|nr:hypothetical protein [Akkermansiaceae bacterium]
MKTVNKLRTVALSAAGILSLSGLALGQDISTHATLDEITKKLDTDGDFLQMNYLKNDIAKILDYGDDTFKALSLNEPDLDFLKRIDMKELFEVLGMNNFIATGRSEKKVSLLWNARQYTYTGGKFNGIGSLYGGVNEKFAITEFAPESTDIAFQMRLDFRQINEVFKLIEKELPDSNEFKTFLTDPVEELKGLTGYQFFDKMNMRALVAIDIDSEKKMTGAGMIFSTPDIVVKVENLAWLWNSLEDAIMENGADLFNRKAMNNVITLEMNEENRSPEGDYLPIFRTDGKSIWIASKKSFLDKTLADGKKLKDSADFKKTMETLPKEGNWLFYVSKDAQTEFINTYRMVEPMMLAMMMEVNAYKPLIDKTIKDLTYADSGFAAVLDVDDSGILFATRSPFTFKSYSENFASITPLVAMLSPIINRAQMRQADLRELEEFEPEVPAEDAADAAEDAAEAVEDSPEDGAAE